MMVGCLIILAQESEELLKTGSASFLDDLYHLGGNSVGARPKILVNYNAKNNLFAIDSKDEYDPWIIKFPALNDLKDIAKIENDKKN